MSFFLILLLLFMVGDVVWLWWADRRLVSLPRAGVWRILSAGFTLAMLGSFMWWIAARRIGSEASPPPILMGLVMVWHLVVLPITLVALLLWGGVAGTIGIRRRLLDRSPAADTVETPPKPQTIGASAPTVELEPLAGISRRTFLGATAAVLPPILTMGATGVGMYQLSGFRVRRLTVPLGNLPAALDGMTIAHVSDTHVGRFTRGRILERIVQATNDLDADLVLFTGDLINDDNDDLPAAIDMMHRMRARAGVYLCEGNHDLIDDGAVFEREVRRAGLNLLLNETASVELRGHEVQVIGLTWGHPGLGAQRRWSGGDAALQAAVDLVRPQITRSGLPILLAHHPHALDYAAAAGIPLTLAGHTHGGQLMLTPNIGPGPMMYRYWSGLYTTANGSAGVVSNGVGNWFPLRINAPAEIVRLTLVRSA